MPWLAEVLLLLLPLAGAGGEDPVIPLVRKAVRDCVAGTAVRVCDLPLLDQPDRRHLRLVTPCKGELALNGHPLRRDGGGFDLTELLSPRSPNRLAIPLACNEAWLHETPRVFIQEFSRPSTAGKLLILIRNTLENTTSFVVTASDSEGRACAEKAGTVPAGASVEVEVACPAPIAGLELWKAPEAIEGAYRFRLAVGEPGTMKNQTEKP